MSPQDQERGSRGLAGRQSSASQRSDGLPSSSVDQPQQPESSRSLSLLSQSRPASSVRFPKSPSDPPPTKIPKVAIPRLPHKGKVDGSVTDHGGRHRVVHACEPCRARKTKCSGEKPACKHCQEFEVTCIYADGKRDRAKKAFGNLAKRVAEYETLLEDLSSRVGEDDANSIKTLLQKNAARGIDSPALGYSSQESDAASEGTGEESEISARVGSTSALDKVEEDFNRSKEARCTGFIGKTSDVNWLQKLKQETILGTAGGRDVAAELKTRTDAVSPQVTSRSSADDKRAPVSDASEYFSLNASSYHLDDFSVFISDTVDVYELPTRATADNLFNAYLQSVHPSFPIIGKITFLSQYRKFVGDPTSNPGERWLAILNMIFAIGSQYSHLVQAEWRGDDRDHLIYFSRARLLSMNGMTIFNHPDLQQVQVSGLIAFYLLASSQINRAWNICGNAVRSAVALGINFRNESAWTPDSSKEIRTRVWWALYTLEYQLSLMTGRPASISDQACTAPLPIPVDEEAFQTPVAVHMLRSEMQKTVRYPGFAFRGTGNSRTPLTSSSDGSRSASKPTSSSRSPTTPQRLDNEWVKGVSPSASLYFLHSIQLTKIAQASLHWLYTPEAVSTTWSHVQSVIGDLNQLITEWHSHLPEAFDFKRKQQDQAFMQQRVCLGFFYYSTRMLINRPCLCRLDRKMPSQSTKSREFNRISAATCVEAGREMLQMLPDKPNAVGLSRVSPWWSVLHYLMQAATVLLLELSYRADHMPEEADSIFEAVQKALRWLHNLGQQSHSARRAWALCDGLLRETAPRIGRQVSQLPEQPPGPIDKPFQFHPQTSSSDWTPGLTNSSLTQSALQSGANFTVTQPEIANMPGVSGYDQYSSFGTSHPHLHFFPTSAETKFFNDAYDDLESPWDPEN